MFDGSIRIDSRIDTKGFNTGINAIIGKFKGLAIAVSAAFAALGIGRFTKTAVDEASAMASALIGLQSVVEGTGNSFQGAQDFINSFVADGLVPARDAITAYKNLLLRGYDTSQIEQTLKALKDSAAFGRQGQLSMGEAISRASEGLKNENSLLVDNAGVTKNVAQMWKDYAASIGTTADKLTKAQKIQAEVNGILEETRFQAGDAAKAANTYAGQVSALGVSFLNFKIAVGNVLIPIITKIIPIIRAAIDALTIFFNRLATVVSIFFGVDLSQQANQTAALADNTQSAADAQGELADETNRAGKAAKGALAAFDQLNVLQQDKEDKPTSTAAVSAPVIDIAETDSSLGALTDKIMAFKENLLLLLAPAIAAFDRLKETLAPLGDLIVQGLGWAWENILVPFGRWAIETFIPAFFDLVSAGVRFLTAALVVLTPIFKWLWDNILKPLAEKIGQLIIWVIRQWTEMLNALAAWLEAHPDLFGSIVRAAEIAWDNVKLFVLNAWKALMDIWSGANVWFVSNVINPIRNAFSVLAEWLKNTFSNAFSNMGGIARGAFNGMIDIINGLLSRIASSINGMANTINQFSWLMGFSIPTVSAPHIPHLATGAVIPPNAQFLAVLGDQRSGRNLEMPENLLRQIVREELGNGNGGEAEVTTQVNLDGEVIFKNQRRVSMRHGKSLLSGGDV